MKLNENKYCKMSILADQEIIKIHIYIYTDFIKYITNRKIYKYEKEKEEKSKLYYF